MEAWVIRYIDTNNQPVELNFTGTTEGVMTECEKHRPMRGTAIKAYDSEGIAAVMYPRYGHMLSERDEANRNESRAMLLGTSEYFWELMARGELAEQMRRARRQ